MQAIDVPYQTHVLEISGNTPIYAPLNVTFLMDEEFQSYKSLVGWLQSFVDEGPWLNLTKDMKLYVLSSNKIPLITFTFVHVFPVNIPDLPLESNVVDPTPITYTVEFRFQWFSVE